MVDWYNIIHFIKSSCQSQPLRERIHNYYTVFTINIHHKREECSRKTAVIYNLLLYMIPKANKSAQSVMVKATQYISMHIYSLPMHDEGDTI